MTTAPTNSREASWKWVVCGLLLLATMMMYMDRQTLAPLAQRISKELHLTNEQYGALEQGFGFAFAIGAIVNGLIADRASIRWLYPVMFIGWSAAGIATAWSLEIGQQIASQFPGLLSEAAGSSSVKLQSETAYLGLLSCRIVLGFFESGHWPCALITTQRLLTANDRPLGN